MILHLSDVHESAEVYADKLTSYLQHKQNWQTNLCPNYTTKHNPFQKKSGEII